MQKSEPNRSRSSLSATASLTSRWLRPAESSPFLSLAVFAALRGEVDITALHPRYEGFIQDLVAHQPDLPPPQED